MPDPPPRVYARHLLPLGYGYPLWTPEPSNQFLRYRRDGLRIGDVGVIVPENGSFDVFFNICLPREHPFHRVNGVPDNFVPIDLDDLDVAIYPHAENPGSVISTLSAIRTIEPSDGATGDQNTLTYKFSLSSSEGALLVLPEGAESYTLLKRKAFRDAAARNAVDWYKFAEQQLGRIITHDSLYLITGCYKSRSWSVAAFHDASSQTGATEFPAQFKAGQGRQGNLLGAYTWETMRGLHWRVGPLGDWSGIPNQAVFLSGFKIAIRDNILGRTRVEVEVDAPRIRSPPGKIFNCRDGRSQARNMWRRLTSRSSGKTENVEQVQADSVHELGTGSIDDVESSGLVTITHIPEAVETFHPSDAINQCLLNKEPSATVAITHDSQWSVLFEQGKLKLEDVNVHDQLENVVFERYCLDSQDGVICLRSTGDCLIGLRDIDDATREAWKADRLNDVEEFFSKQISRRMGGDHCAYANRALVRARLYNWDGALRDAEISIDIQPSVTAYVARGFVLFAQEQNTLAVQAFNEALRECDIRDKVLVSLVKILVSFYVGYPAENMGEIADLVEHCPLEVKPVCLAVQASMYSRLATLATLKQDYDGAFRHLTRALEHGPFHSVSGLETISLICGWNLDKLQFTLLQQKCELLYVAGHIHEAMEVLRDMKRDLAEDVRMGEENSTWIQNFTEQCITLYESFSVPATSSKNTDVTSDRSGSATTNKSLKTHKGGEDKPTEQYQ